MKTNKTAGMEGLTAEFYKTFFSKSCMTSLHRCMLIYTLTTQHLKKSMKKTVTVLPPKEPYSETPSDYRPITLLNID